MVLSQRQFLQFVNFLNDPTMSKPIHIVRLPILAEKWPDSRQLISLLLLQQVHIEAYLVVRIVGKQIIELLF